MNQHFTFSLEGEAVFSNDYGQLIFVLPRTNESQGFAFSDNEKLIELMKFVENMGYNIAANESNNNDGKGYLEFARNNIRKRLNISDYRRLMPH